MPSGDASTATRSTSEASDAAAPRPGPARTPTPPSEPALTPELSDLIARAIQVGLEASLENFRKQLDSHKQATNEEIGRLREYIEELRTFYEDRLEDLRAHYAAAATATEPTSQEVAPVGVPQGPLPLQLIHEAGDVLSQLEGDATWLGQRPILKVSHATKLLEDKPVGSQSSDQQRLEAVLAALVANAIEDQKPAHASDNPDFDAYAVGRQVLKDWGASSELGSTSRTGTDPRFEQAVQFGLN
jgi:hypothetical protein